MENMSNMITRDRLSALPDSVLLHILSLLDMIQVQKTSVLSKRWQYIWTSVPTLTFQYTVNDTEKMAKFVAWVHRMLLRCRNSIIEKFDVCFCYSDCFASDVDGWARFVLEKEVKELNLVFYDSGSYSLPHSICCNSFLINLSLYGCKLVPKRGLSWARLKSLSMSSVELNDDTIVKILSSSPMLESLKFQHCWGFTRLHINSGSLKKFTIYYSMEPENRVDLRISASNLQSLYIRGGYKNIQFPLMGISSMIRVQLECSVYSKDGLCFDEIKLLESLRHVRELELGKWCIQALAPLLVEGKTLSSPLTALTCLKVNASIDKQVAAGIISLLKCSPNLENLVLKRPLFRCGQESPYHKQVEEYWESGGMIEKFSLPRLKTVKCHGFKKLADAGEFTITLVQVLLENAGFLKYV